MHRLPDPAWRRGLRELVRLREELQRLERSLVVAAREDGASWREIGDELGIALQSAWQRHAGADPQRRQREPNVIDEVRAFHRDPAAYFRLPESIPVQRSLKGSDPFSSC